MLENTGGGAGRQEEVRGPLCMLNEREEEEEEMGGWKETPLEY